MCLILFALQPHTRTPLVLAANRDEFYNRPTAPMDFWPDKPHILAGRDLLGKGTWLGISTKGRFAALTNFRDPGDIRTDAPSRGDIIVQYLESGEPARTFLERFKTTAAQFNGFNLLAGDLAGNPDPSLYWFSNRKGEIHRISPGVHGLSNRFLDSPWPKVEKGIKALARGPGDNAALFGLLSDNSIAPDHALPHTGVGLEWERLLSPLFIQSPGYGTRSSTLVRLHARGRIEAVERTYDTSDPDRFTDCSFVLTLPNR